MARSVRLSRSSGSPAGRRTRVSKSRCARDRRSRDWRTHWGQAKSARVRSQKHHPHPEARPIARPERRVRPSSRAITRVNALRSLEPPEPRRACLGLDPGMATSKELAAVRRRTLVGDLQPPAGYMVPGACGLCRIRGTTHRFILDSSLLWSPPGLLITFGTVLSVAPLWLPDLVLFRHGRREPYAANRRVPIRPRFVPDSFQFSTKLRNYGDNSPRRCRRMRRAGRRKPMVERNLSSATPPSSEEDRPQELFFCPTIARENFPLARTKFLTQGSHSKHHPVKHMDNQTKPKIAETVIH